MKVVACYADQDVVVTQVWKQTLRPHPISQFIVQLVSLWSSPTKKTPLLDTLDNTGRNFGLNPALSSMHFLARLPWCACGILWHEVESQITHYYIWLWQDSSYSLLLPTDISPVYWEQAFNKVLRRTREDKCWHLNVNT